MLVCHARTRVAAPLDRVYEYLMDVENFPSYDKKAHKLEYLDRDADRVRISGTFGFIPYAAEFQLTRWPGKGYQSELVAGPLAYARGRFLVNRIDDATTELIHIEEFRFHPPAGWMLEKLMKSYVQGTVDREVELVRQHVEAGLPQKENQYFPHPDR